MSNSEEQSLKDKVKQIAESRGCLFNQAWQILVLERFLARLSRSEHRDKLIFKGGMLLGYYLNLGRETRDLDFLLKQIANEKDLILRIITEITSVNLNDAFSFEVKEIESMDHLMTKYPGFAVRLVATCGKTKSKINLDIGVGDLVVDEAMKIPLSKTAKGSIFEEEISLLVYPPENIFAEKLETAIFRGLENSRMKDFHDMWVMAISNQSVLGDAKKLTEVLIATFEHRETEFSLLFTEGNIDFAKQETYWQNHLKSIAKNKLDYNLPNTFEGLISEINIWLKNNIVK